MVWSQYDARRRRPRPSSAEQTRFRETVLRRAEYRCTLNGPRCLGVATIADHKVPWAEGGSNDPVSNGQALCVPCHDAKTQEEARRGMNRWKRNPPRHPGMNPL